MLELSKLLTKTDKESFIGAFNQWQIKWDTFLKERSSDKTSKSRYTHQRLRSAYLSLKRNMKWLWTFYDHPSIGIPNTNNALEGTFTDIKTKLRVHSGIKNPIVKNFLMNIFPGIAIDARRGLLAPLPLGVPPVCFSLYFITFNLYTPTILTNRPSTELVTRIIKHKKS